jgi:hypothetical protein
MSGDYEDDKQKDQETEGFVDQGNVGFRKTINHGQISQKPGEGTQYRYQYTPAFTDQPGNGDNRQQV